MRLWYIYEERNVRCEVLSYIFVWSQAKSPMTFPLSLTQAVALILVSCIISVAIAYPDRCVGVSSRSDLQGPRGLPFVGNLFHVWPYRRHMITWMEEQTHIYGKLFTFNIPVWGRTIVINRPEWLAHVKKSTFRYYIQPRSSTRYRRGRLGDVVGYTRGSVSLDVFGQFPGVKTPVASEGAEWRNARRTIQ